MSKYRERKKERYMQANTIEKIKIKEKSERERLKKLSQTAAAAVKEEITAKENSKYIKPKIKLEAAK